jgi:uncharacterized protein (TIGR02145 family)
MKIIFLLSMLLTFLPFINNMYAQTINDVEGNSYKTVTINDQVWMAENLRTTKYNDGTEIPLNGEAANWDALTEPAYCFYNNDVANKETYGALYNWHTVAQNKLCPQGWHVPTKDDWDKLMGFIDKSKYAETSAQSLKSKEGWKKNDGLDAFGFNGLAAGFLSWGGFYYAGESAYWWSVTEEHSGYVKIWSIDDVRKAIQETILDKTSGASVRCIKN